MEEIIICEENDDIFISWGVVIFIVLLLLLGICIICFVKRKMLVIKGKFIFFD